MHKYAQYFYKAMFRRNAEKGIYPIHLGSGQIW